MPQIISYNISIFKISFGFLRTTVKRCQHERLKRSKNLSPTDPSTILDPQNPSEYASEPHQISRSPDLESLKLHVFKKTYFCNPYCVLVALLKCSRIHSFIIKSLSLGITKSNGWNALGLLGLPRQKRIVAEKWPFLEVILK